MRRRRSFIFLALLLPVSLAALAFLAFDTNKAHAPSSQAAFRGCSPQEASTESTLVAVPTPTPFGPDISNAILNQPENASPFVGRLCDFAIVATEDEAQPETYCEGDVSFVGGPDARNPGNPHGRLHPRLRRRDCESQSRPRGIESADAVALATRPASPAETPSRVPTPAGRRA
jgi:hypothetical protein